MVEAGPVDDALTPLMAHLDQKDFRVVSLDSKNGILANRAIDKGVADATRELTAAGRALDIEVQDHVVAHDGYTSDRERGLASTTCGARSLPSASVTKLEVEECPK